MHIFAQAFWLPKLGNSDEEYEDAYWSEQHINREANNFSFAVADGATETSFSGLWARMLVRAYCKGQLHRKRLHKSLLDLQRKWLEQVSKGSLPWYAEEKLRDGAFSALVGLTIKGVNSGEGKAAKWEAMAIGDCCLFQIKGQRLVYAFPLEESEQFNSRPSLLSSNHAYNNSLVSNVVRTRGVLESGDEFYLMTDALACWFLRAIEQNDRPSEDLREHLTPERFESWIMELRKDKLIRNDDVTLFYVEAT